ncbi:MAG: hypothetical protein K6F57_02130 [Candidatus Saccharibacteria bacterium]|nr:hypothetical protein [Candidatus Saccharibacteria bacterium]
MAKLTNKEYLARRKFLQKLWDNEKTQGAFCFLSPNKQQTLHHYFATNKYDWIDEQVLNIGKQWIRVRFLPGRIYIISI